MEEAADAVLDRVMGNRVIPAMVAGAVVGKGSRTWMNEFNKTYTHCFTIHYKLVILSNGVHLLR